MLRQWSALSPARQEVFRRYDWSLADLPETIGWTTLPRFGRSWLAVIALALHELRGSGDLMQRMAEAMYGLMGFGAV